MPATRARVAALLLLTSAFFGSCSLTSLISSRLFTPSFAPHSAAERPGFLPGQIPPLAAAVKQQHRLPLSADHPADGRRTLPAADAWPAVRLAPGEASVRRSDGAEPTTGWIAAGLAVATFALVFRRLATPVAAFATDGENDGSDDNTWNDGDLDALKDQLEVAYSHNAVTDTREISDTLCEAQYYADSDMPSDVEFFTPWRPEQQYVPKTIKKDRSRLHAFFGFVAKEMQDLHRTCVEDLHNWKPNGFPFHHFPAPKRNVELFASSKDSKTP